MFLFLICSVLLTSIPTEGLNVISDSENSTLRKKDDLSGCKAWPKAPGKGLYFPPPTEDVLDNHDWLKLSIESREDSDGEDTEKREIRIRIWPNPLTIQKEVSNRGQKDFSVFCTTPDHEKELFGRMKIVSTFVVPSENFAFGLCLQVELEEHGRWVKEKKTKCEDFHVTFEGNGDDKERATAIAFTIVGYLGFSLGFLQLWYCLLRTDRFL